MNDNYYPYFHVSEDFLGMSVQMFPAVPKRLAPGEDAVTPRICVAPRISNCLRMVAWTDYRDDFHVYGLVTNPMKAGLSQPNAEAVPDLDRSFRHQERWLTRKSGFAYLGRVRMSRVDLVTGRPCYYWLGKEQEYYHDDPDCMTAEQVQAFLNIEAYHQQVAAEMQAEIEAKGGVMVGDALQKHIDALPPNVVLVPAARCELHDQQNCPAGVCKDDPKAKPSCWHCGEPGAEDCGKHTETELRHAALEGD